MGCRWHLLAEQLRQHQGRRAWQFLTAEDGVALLEELPESCALDVADRGGITLQEVAGLVRLTRERVRQIEITAAERLGLTPRLKELKELSDDGR